VSPLVLDGHATEKASTASLYATCFGGANRVFTVRQHTINLMSSSAIDLRCVIVVRRWWSLERVRYQCYHNGARSGAERVSVIYLPVVLKMQLQPHCVRLMVDPLQ